MSPSWPWRRRGSRPRAPLARVGDTVDLEVLGAGRVGATVERVAELRPEGVRGLAWRVTLRLPDGGRAHAIKFGDARLCFIDPRHRVAGSGRWADSLRWPRGPARRRRAPSR